MVFTKQHIEQFSLPIGDEAPCGIYLKADKGAFRPLRNEFNVAQTALRKLSQNPSEDEIEALQESCIESWGTLAESLQQQFTSTTRDIELISWFVAALTLLDDTLESTANGLEWLANLVDVHWSELNPVLPVEKLKSDDEQGQVKEQTDIKVKAFFQLVGDSEESSILYAPLLHLNLVGDVTFFDFQSAERKGEIAAIKSPLTSTIAQQRSNIQSKLDNLAQCVAQLDRLSALVAKYAQASATQTANFTFAKSLFVRVENALIHLTGMKPSSTNEVASSSSQPQGETHAEVANMEDSPSLETPVSTGGAVQSTPLLHSGNLSELGSINNMNRDLAFHLLREVSDYFRQSEPHSPISFLLEKAIRWGYLSLPELLEEMMAAQSGDTLNNIFNTVGLNHTDQVLLPEVDSSAVEKNRTASQPIHPSAELPHVEHPVSQTSTVDTPSQQENETFSSESSGLSW